MWYDIFHRKLLGGLIVVIKSRICIASVILVFSMPAMYCFGAAEPRNPQTPDPKAAEAATRIQQSLGVILPEANKGLRPAAGMIAGGQKTLDESKRYLSQMDDKQKAQYCLLQSWAAYYGGSMDTALMNAAKACKLDATSGDAWASQVAMALLANKRPMMPQVPKPVRTPRNRQNQGGMESPGAAAAQIQKGKLDFELNLFLADVVGKKITPLELHCFNGTTLAYQPGNEGLCLLFWRKFEVKVPVMNTEPNGNPIPQVAVAAPVRETNPMDSFGQPSLEGTPEGAFSKLFGAGLGGGRMKFLAVNLDTPANRKVIAEEILRQPQVWAQAIIADQAGGTLSEFNSIPLSNPVLVMADTTGTIRYAGPATSFIAPMLLEGIASGKAAGTGVMEEKTEIAAEPVVSAVTPADSNALTVMDSNSLIADSNSVPKAVQAPAVQKPVQKPAIQQPAQQAGQPQNHYKELSEEDTIQAEKLVTYAEDLFMKAAGKHVITYKRGVDLCRQVMKDYAGSEYAERARQLLRKVPENQRERLGITDQELGL
jgi:hypothetical protein